MTVNCIGLTLGAEVIQFLNVAVTQRVLPVCIQMAGRIVILFLAGNKLSLKDSHLSRVAKN